MLAYTGPLPTPRFPGPYHQKKKPRTFRAGESRLGGYYGRYSKPGGELKFYDYTLDDAVVAAAGTVTASINTIAQGVTEQQRVGRKCIIRKISWRWRSYLPEANDVNDPAQPDIIRIMLFLDKQCNGATAAVTDILETANYLSFNNLANSGRFVILLDKTVSLNYDGMGSTGAGIVAQAEHTVHGSYHKKVNIPLEFDAATGAITEIRSNNLGVLLLSVNGVCGFESRIRLRFSDM